MRDLVRQVAHQQQSHYRPQVTHGVGQETEWTPTRAISTPAIEGPMTAAPLNTDELRAIAFIRSCLPTMSTRNDCRAGTSNRFIVPVASAARITIQYCAWPLALRMNSANDGTMKADWVRSRTFCLRKRSATTPPSWLPMRTGVNCAASTRPTRSPLCVSSSASHGMATLCIHVPTVEMI